MASELSVAEGCDLLLAQLNRLEVLPEKAVFAAERVLMAQVPYYSGTYHDSIQIVSLGGGAWMVHVSVEKMISEALNHPELFSGGKDASGEFLPLDQDREAGRDYVFDEAHGRFGKEDFPSGPYPLRIEAQGALLSDKGLGMWGMAAQAAAEEIRDSMKRIASTR